ncbi:MAG TPA: toprim domain-containing protein [Acidiphilium sp.]|nr:toprim domain-containing protein [Acidiphilium sp.]
MQTIGEIITRLNLSRAGRWHRGTCPNCGKPSLSVAEGRAGIKATCHYGCDRDALREALGAGKLPQRDPEADQRETAARASATEAAAKIWGGADPVTPDDPAGRYLTARHLAAAIGNDRLRYRRDTPHPSGARWPAMICRIDNAAGDLVAVHRVYLDLDGRKAPLEPAKAAKGPLWGGAIRFATGPEIVVAEGPETAIAAGLILSLPAWSAISAGNMARGLILPPDVRRVVIAADHDRPGTEAAEAAGRRWKAEGRAVRIVRPDRPGDDFADVLAQRAGSAN